MVPARRGWEIPAAPPGGGIPHRPRQPDYVLNAGLLTNDFELVRDVFVG